MRKKVTPAYLKILASPRVFPISAALVLLAVCIEVVQAGQPPSQPIKVAAIQFNPKLGVLHENVDALAEQFESAAKRGAKIIVAPEMATTGYLYVDRRDIAEVVDTIPGPTTRRFEKIASKYGCYLVWGMPERDPETALFYNSAAIVGPEGFVGKYRKTHLWESEAHWSAWGNLGVPVFDTIFGRVALLICQDANYVETFRLAALAGADIVCFSTNSSGQTIGHLQARAIQNGVFIVSANRSDTEVDSYSGDPFRMKGCSAIWCPDGRKLAEAGIDGPETVYATIDPAAFPTRVDRLSERRPETYVAMARHVAPWNMRATNQPRWIEAVAVQYRPLAGKKIANRELVERMLDNQLDEFPARCNHDDDTSESRHATRLIVLPELSLVGRAAAGRMRGLAEELGNGPTHRWAVGLARRFHAFVVCGFPERDGEKLFNAVTVVNRDGKRIGHARKVHLTAEDRNWATAGDGWTVVRAGQLGRLGILIGKDSYVPESGTVMAIQRADIVVVPASWHGEIAGDGAIAINPAINPHASRKAMVLWDEMAWGQQFYAVVANMAGDQDRPGGRSGIYSTDPIYGITSPAIARRDGQEVVVGEFQTLNGDHPEHWIDQHHYIGSRRPDALYHPLIVPSTSRRASAEEQALPQLAP
jgi:predicted amidohydrolase